MIKRLLIANRGEIACRIMHSAKKLGIHTIAIYSTADANALHVHKADSAYCIGPPAASESYLNQDKIIDIARNAKACAIHPGYGFLAENADFARRCAKENIVFVGPNAGAIDSMGSKAHAKALMQQAGVPLLPGYHGDDQSEATLLKHAKDIGFPVLIKASLGGGGKGMKIVHSADEFSEALASAKREAASSFGDDHVLIEKYCQNPRHIEVQILADKHNNVRHLYERDCSIQRRMQKIIEEAPAADLSPALREHLQQAAIQAAMAVNYDNAGTIEFLVEDEHCYFMEMNTRLQVEHPVTEMVTGIDIVAWQLHIAAGLELTLTQEDIHCHGHAMEARLCAENVSENFRPATGTLTVCRFPTATQHTRIETGVRENDVITPYYDPMIAKLVAYGDNRDAANTRLQQLLANTLIDGVHTNKNYLLRILQHDDFCRQPPNTNFIATHTELQQEIIDSPHLLCLAASLLLCQSNEHKPLLGFRLNQCAKQRIEFLLNQQDFFLELQCQQGEWQFYHEDWDKPLCAQIEINDSHIMLVDDKTQYGLSFTKLNDAYLLVFNHQQYHLQTATVLEHYNLDEHTENTLVAPMPATVVDVCVKAGEQVTKNTVLMILEAMKMEHTIRAPDDGCVETFYFNTGDLVSESQELLMFSPKELVE